MFKPVPKDIRNQILTRVKENGESVSKLAAEFGISNRTIYGWLRKQSEKHVSVLEYAKLKRENKLLLEIVGKLTLEKNQISNLKKS